MIFRRDEGQRDWIDSELSKIEWPDLLLVVVAVEWWENCSMLLHIRGIRHFRGMHPQLSPDAILVWWPSTAFSRLHGTFWTACRPLGWCNNNCKHWNISEDGLTGGGGLVILSDTSFQTFNAFKLYYHPVVSLEVGVSRLKAQALWAFAMEHMWHLAWDFFWDQKVPKKTGQGKPMEMESHRPTFLDPKNFFSCESNQWSAQKQPQPPCSQLRLVL